MASLGSLGTAVYAVDPDTFEYFGAIIRTNPAVSELDLIDFMEIADRIDLEDSRQNVAAMVDVKRFIRACIHPDDFPQFWTAVRANRQDLMALVTVGAKVVEAAVGRPTGRPAASGSGPQTTPPTSSSDSQDKAREFLARHPGRPDLQAAGMLAVQHRGNSEGQSQRTA